MSDQYPPQDPNGQDPYRQQPTGGQQPWGPPAGGHAPQQPWGQPPTGQPYGGQTFGGPQGGAPHPSGSPMGQQPGRPPLWAPWYGIPFPQAFTRFWVKYVRFDGRASRSEYWFWALWWFIGSIVASALGSGIDAAVSAGGTDDRVGQLWALATFLGFIALTVRRLHDVNLSGYFAFFFIIPPIGVLFSLIVGLMGSVPQGQRFDRPVRG